MTDDALRSAIRLLTPPEVSGPQAAVTGFFDEATCTASYVVQDPSSRACAIIDSVLDFDPAAGRISHDSADRIADFVAAHGLEVVWHLETHIHADHLSAAPYLQGRLGGRLGIGKGVLAVQQVFGKIFNAGSVFERDGGAFDHLFEDGEGFAIGGLPVQVLHVPGHTPADIAFVTGGAVFVGDTLFMPDYGTARADFPGGDARQLYRSIRRLLQLPAETRLFVCHDYKAPGRDAYAWETTVGAEKSGNVHIHDSIGEEDFVAMRQARDATLAMPKLILPSVQVNMCGGRLPEPESNGHRYLKLPINVF